MEISLLQNILWITLIIWFFVSFPILNLTEWFRGWRRTKNTSPATYKISQMLTDYYKRRQSGPRNVSGRGGCWLSWLFRAGAPEIKLQRGRLLVSSPQPCSVGLRAVSSQWERENLHYLSLGDTLFFFLALKNDAQLCMAVVPFHEVFPGDSL